MAPTLTDATSPSGGSSGVVRAAVVGEGPGAKLVPASPWCAIAHTASDPTLRTVQGGTAGRSCEEEGSSPNLSRVAPRAPPSPPAAGHCAPGLDAVNVVRPRLPLRALHIDGVFAAGVSAPLSGRGAEMLLGCWLLGPAGGIVGGSVAGQREGDPVRAVRQCAGNDPAVLPRAFKPAA